MTEGRRKVVLAGLVAFVVGFPLLVFAASPHALLPGLPRFRYDPLDGDAYGYYYCVRQIISVLRHNAPLVSVAALIAVTLIWLTFRQTPRAALRLLAIFWGCGIVVATVMDRVQPNGAAQFGWPLVWSVPMLPLAAVGGSLDPDVAYGFALALSLVCNGLIVLATHRIARGVGLSERLAVAGAALVAFWPLLSLLGGQRAASNGTWQNWLGLSAYTEPASTCFVLVALAIVVDRRFGQRGAVIAGALLGLGTAIRLSNALVIGCILVWLAAARRLRQATLLALAALAWLPAEIIYWPKGYPSLPPRVFATHPFTLHYADVAWSQNLLWHPATLLVIVPVALVGIARVDRHFSALLWSCVAVTALLYTFYFATPQHPRFLFVVLPIVLVYWAAGVSLLLQKLSSLR
jgi:hypothetical protein